MCGIPLCPQLYLYPGSVRKLHVRPCTFNCIYASFQIVLSILLCAVDFRSHLRPVNQKTKKPERVSIVGSGLFGLTTALELAERGYKVLVLDRDLPAVRDGPSVDISRVIWPDYADEFYSKMGLEAMKGWEEEYAPYFRRSGLLCIARRHTHSYLETSRNNVEEMGLQVETLEGQQLRERYPAMQRDLGDAKGYFNPICGWADA